MQWPCSRGLHISNTAVFLGARSWSGSQTHTRALGGQPAYTCSSQNAASVAVAHKLGYVEVEEVRGYILYHDDEGTGNQG